jgi:hypothetical protein
MDGIAVAKRQGTLCSTHVRRAASVLGQVIASLIINHPLAGSTSMRFTIRDLLLIIALVAVSLGWWLDRSRLAARDAAWEHSFQSALERLSFHVQKEKLTFDSPSGPWRVHCTHAVDLPDDAE